MLSHNAMGCSSRQDDVGNEETQLNRFRSDKIL